MYWPRTAKMSKHQGIIVKVQKALAIKQYFLMWKPHVSLTHLLTWNTKIYLTTTTKNSFDMISKHGNSMTLFLQVKSIWFISDIFSLRYWCTILKSGLNGKQCFKYLTHLVLPWYCTKKRHHSTILSVKNIHDLIYRDSD